MNERYKVLLVDDEEEIRLGISSSINWHGLGLELVGLAENGAEALELAEELRPDIVLTDIRMPFLDGLALCEQLRTKLPTAKTVVFSGFDEFEYAQRAIKMNVSQYILKPINSAELQDVLRSLTAELDELLAQRRDMDKLRRRYDENLPILREMFFTRLLDGRIDARHIADRAARYEIVLPDSAFVVALIQPEMPAAEERDELLLLSVQGLLDKHFLWQGSSASFLYNDCIALLLALGATQTLSVALEELGRICMLSRSYLGIPVTIGVGRVHQGAQSLHLSAREAHAALDYRALTTSGRVIYLADIEPQTPERIAFGEEDERTLLAAVKMGTEEDLVQLFHAFSQRITDIRADFAQCQLFFLELTAALLRLTRSSEMPPEDVFGANFSGLVQLGDFHSLEETLHWCSGCALRLRSLLHTRRTDTNWHTIERAKAYIAQNFSDESLGVDALCAYLHLSAAYFSTLFKRETGKSFITYLTDLRIETAVRLLQETDEKTYQIAERCGYSDPNYFSYVFKKQVGVSPSKFRAAQNAR